LVSVQNSNSGWWEGRPVCGVVVLRRTLLPAVDGFDAGPDIHPFLTLDSNARTPGPEGTHPYPLARRMDEALQFADVTLGQFLEDTPHRALVRKPPPPGNTPQHGVGPQHHALADAARPTQQTDQHQKNGVNELIAFIVCALLVHMAMEQSGKSQCVEIFDHRNQPGLAGKVAPAAFMADLCGRFTCRF